MNVTMKDLNDMGLVVETLSDSSYMVSWDKKTKLTEIIIPDSVDGINITKISSSFSGDLSIRKVVMPNTVTEIEDHAFFKCESLEIVKLSNNLTAIRGSTFCNCTSLKEIVIHNGVKSIGSNAFLNCVECTIQILERQNESLAEGLFSKT